MNLQTNVEVLAGQEVGPVDELETGQRLELYKSSIEHQLVTLLTGQEGKRNLRGLLAAVDSCDDVGKQTKRRASSETAERLRRSSAQKDCSCGDNACTLHLERD